MQNSWKLLSLIMNMEDSFTRPIRTPTISEQNVQHDIKRSQNKPLNLADLQDHKLEAEDDTGKI
jgi:hypothetical protein